MSKDTVHAAYLMALRDERETLNDMKARGENVAIEARAMLATCEACLKQGFGGDMLEYMRGSRDFWRNQIKILNA